MERNNLIDKQMTGKLPFTFQEKMRIIARERELRCQAERRRDEIAREFLDYQQRMKEVHETLVGSFSSSFHRSVQMILA